MVAVPDPGQGGRRDRGGGPAHGGAPRVRRRRAQLPRPHRLAGRGRDRERAALRGDAATGAGPDHADPAEPGARRRSPCARTSTRRSPAAPASCCAPTPARSTASTSRPTSWRWSAPTRTDAPSPARAPAAPALVLDLIRRATGRARGGAAGSLARSGPTSTRTRCWSRRWWRATSSSGCSAASPTTGSSADEDAELLRAVANQTAVGLKKAELIERLTAENIVKDMFDALAAGSVEAVEAKASEAHCDLGRPHVFLHVERAPRRAEDAGPGRSWPRASSRGCAVSIRGPSSTPATTGCARWLRCRAREDAEVEQLRAACEPIGPRRGAGRGTERRRHGGGVGPAPDARGGRRGADRPLAGRRRAGPSRYEQLGAYRYLVHLELDERPARPLPPVGRGARRVRPPARGASLVETLERYLADRGSVTASARALYVHPNTVRQRLDRIERVADLDLAGEDLLSLELALKLARLHRVRAEMPSRRRRPRSAACLARRRLVAPDGRARSRRSRSRPR